MSAFQLLYLISKYYVLPAIQCIQGTKELDTLLSRRSKGGISSSSMLYVAITGSGTAVICYQTDRDQAVCCRNRIPDNASTLERFRLAITTLDLVAIS